MFYLLLLLLELLLPRISRRLVGRVRDALGGSPVSLAVVRLVHGETRQVLATKVTTPQGQFFLMPTPGQYDLHVLHPAYHPYTHQGLRVRKGRIGGIVRLQANLTPRSAMPRQPTRPQPSPAQR